VRPRPSFKHPAIVIGGEHNALGIIRNLGQHGVRARAFVQRFRRKGFVAHTVRELQTLLRLVTQQDIDVMIQEIIPGPISGEYVIRGYFNNSSELMGLHIVQSVRSCPFTVSSAMISVPIDHVEEVYPVLVKYLAQL
jgi:predicted ATP-grasp superfamily ATP-dependent carboligase